MAAFDVAIVIAEFASDMTRTSIELPHMTTGQRKCAKKLLEQYPELRCESYGFGAERQLHLFKENSNTGQHKETEQDSDCMDKSNAMTLFPVGIKNTFIDWLAPENVTVDKRAVQSMPHGMFRQCVLEEVSQGSTGCSTPSTTDYDTPATVFEAELESMVCPLDEAQGRLCSPFKLGTLVVVEGLVKAPAFNGCSAVVQGWDEATGRYNILVGTPDGCQQAKIKEDNLRLALPCP